MIRFNFTGKYAVYRYNTHRFTLSNFKDSNGDTLDISANTYTCQVRSKSESDESGDPVLEYTVSNIAGLVTFLATRAEILAASITVGEKYNYDVKETDGTGYEYPILGGDMEFATGATR